jgi:hypothetical protein
LTLLDAGAYGLVTVVAGSALPRTVRTAEQAALPASAAPSTKFYSAALADSLDGGQSVTVTSKATGSNTVTLHLRNQLNSQQTFGSAQLDFTGSPLPTNVSAPGWTTKKLSLTRFQVVSAPSGNQVAPGSFIPVTITLPATAPGTTKLSTEVRQSNDFKGTNNDFTLVTPPYQPLVINTLGSCTSTCTPTTAPSPINKVTADLTITASEPFAYIARFTLDRLSCDTIPFGPTVTPEPFQVDTQTTVPTPISKRLVLTFPKALANLVPDNGTPHHPVCAGGDAPFPGSDPTTQAQRDAGTATHPHEGLLLNCSDPAYVTQADDAGILPMCVSSRARSAGKLVVTVLVQETTVDPRIW